MKPALLTVVLLLIGIGTGYYVGSGGALPGARGSPVDTREGLDLRERRVEDLERIRQLEAEIADLKRQLASKPEEEEPYPGDTPEELEKLLEAVYGENNIDLFIDVLDRLLCMGEKGWPSLKISSAGGRWRRSWQGVISARRPQTPAVRQRIASSTRQASTMSSALATVMRRGNMPTSRYCSTNAKLGASGA